MKNEEEASTFHIHEIAKAAIRCIQGNEVFEYCINEKCQSQQIFLCSLKQCKCCQDHELCSKGNCTFTINHIYKKMFNTTELKQIIEDAFTSMIDKLSQSKEKILAMVDSRVKHILLHPIQNNFLSMVSSGRNQNFRSKDSSKLQTLMSQNYQQNKLKIFTEISQNLANLQQKVANISKESQEKIFICPQLTEIKSPSMNIFSKFLDFQSAWKFSQLQQTKPIASTSPPFTPFQPQHQYAKMEIKKQKFNKLFGS